MSMQQLISALNNSDFPKAEKLIAANNALLTEKNAEDVTVLEYYCGIRKKNTVMFPEIIEWLCKQLVKANISIDFYDDHQIATIQNLYHSSCKETVKILLQYTDLPNLRQWLVQRQLICVLGANFLLENNFKLSQQQIRSAEGGFAWESAHLLYSAVSYLLNEEQQYATIKESVRIYYENSNRQELANREHSSISNLLLLTKSPNNPRVIFNVSCKTHIFAASIKRINSNMFQISFYDGNRPEVENLNLQQQAKNLVTGEFAVIRRIDVPLFRLFEIIRKLILDTKDKTLEEVYVLLDNLPNTLRTAYVYDQNIFVDVNKQERNRCYWANPHYAIYDLFVDQFGVEEGAREFNTFLTSMSLKLIDNFKKEFTDQYDAAAVNKLEEIVVNQKKIEAPKSFAVTLAKTVAFFAGVFCLSLGLPMIFFTGASIGLMSIVTVGLFLTAYPLMPTIVSFFTNDTAPVDLVNAQAVKMNNARLKHLISTKQITVALSGLEAKQAEKPAPKKPSGFKSFLNRFTVFRDTPKVEPVVVPVTTMNAAFKDDLGELWKLPTSVIPAQAGIHSLKP